MASEQSKAAASLLILGLTQRFIEAGLLYVEYGELNIDAEDQIAEELTTELRALPPEILKAAHEFFQSAADTLKEALQ